MCYQFNRFEPMNPDLSPPSEPLFAIPGDCGLRGDYSAMAKDWTVDQDWDAYSPAEHDRWRRLYRRQSALIVDYAAPAFINGLAALDCGEELPHFDAASARLSALTGWRLAVPGLIPNDIFFGHLAARQFPVCRWLREEAELDYLVEPDVFHDFFGHIPLLTDPVFAAFVQAYGRHGLSAKGPRDLELMTRLYWYMVEFGLIQTKFGLRAIGAGLVSSAGELLYSVDSADPLRIGFDQIRVLRTLYRIDAYQRTYFVLNDFDQLFQSIDAHFHDALEIASRSEAIAAGSAIAGDQIIDRAGGPTD
jgi:phenylalanine-4-hydroxylase